MGGRWRVDSVIARGIIAGVAGAVLSLPIAATGAGNTGSDAASSAEELQQRMPRVGAVDGVKLEWVARRMTSNGLPMQIRQLSSQRRLDAVADAYARRLERLGVIAPHRKDRNGFSELYGALGPYFVRVQLGRRNDRTVGYVSVMAQPGTVETDRSTELPLPESVTLATRKAFGRGGGDGETLMGYSDDLPGVLVNDFRRVFNDSPWQRQKMAKQSENRPAMRERAALLYERRGQRLQIIIVRRDQGPANRSVVMIHWRKGES